ncbi:MAG: ATP-binding cassette domain-containing protein [Planctomycetota bacterium]|nr:MAG: ATP-binding cassette domain-containing protein [Planctomycetota bacterium]
MTDHGGTRDPSFSLSEARSESPEPAIQVRDLHKSFGNRPVLRSLSLDVRRSELLAIVGGSGSGKSVLLKHLAGLIRPDRGSIRLDGVDLATAGKEAIRDLHRKIGYLFQDGGLLNSLTVFENVALPLREMTSSGEEEIRQRVTDSLARVGVGGTEAKMPQEMSGGMRKRAGLARAIVEERSFFFFDEPTSALDPVTAMSIRDLIREVHDRWKSTSLVVTHDLRLVQKVADRVAFLHEGVIRRMGTFDELSASDDSVVRDFFTADYLWR